MKIWGFIHFATAIISLALCVDSIVHGSYAWATWYFGWGVVNIYQGIKWERD